MGIPMKWSQELRIHKNENGHWQTCDEVTEQERLARLREQQGNDGVHFKTGTTQKCTACEKTVYLVDKLTANSRVYHKACFRCHHCNGTLKLGNFNSFEGVLYCRPHFDQIFKRTGSLDKSFEGTPKIVKPGATDNENAATANRVSAFFAGTRDKCASCNKTAYPIEKVTVNGTGYHKRCFKCAHGGCTISPSNYIAHEGKLYCKHHHTQLFKEKGNYSQLDTSNKQFEATKVTAVEVLAE